MGAQIVTHTEATFVTEQKVQGSIAAAPVFPKTIYTLKQTAKRHEKVILQVYENMKKEVEEEASIEVLENRLVSWKEQREKSCFRARVITENIYRNGRVLSSITRKPFTGATSICQREFKCYQYDL